MAYQPKSYKKFVATAATATLVATAVVPAAFADEVKPAAFTDVAQQYEAAVNFVVEQNIAKGLSETQFGVGAQIKRGDAAIMIANAAKINNPEAPASGFSDVPTRGVLAINSLKAAGIINGKSATNFGFNDSITRGEAAIMFANAFDLTGDITKVKFSDVSSRYLNAVAALVEEGVTNGISATQFGTSNNIKRGDFARFVYALEEYIVDEEVAAGVTALNAKQIAVSFSAAVNPETLFVDGKEGAFKANTVVVNSLDNKAAGTLTGKLSTDGKTLTIETQNGLKGRYDVKVENLETTTDEVVKDIFETITVNDTIVPAIASTQTVNANQVKVTFSEPLQSLGNVTFKLADGTPVTDITNNFNAVTNNKEVTFSFGPSVKAGTSVVATFVGTQDYAGNLISPNPSTTTLFKGNVDGVEPVVTSVTPLNAREFEVNFSEALIANPSISLVGYTGTLKVTKDEKIPTKYLVETSSPVSGLQTVQVSNYTDLSGEAGEAFSRVINFVADVTAPKLQSSSVVTVNGIEYLQLTFDESVTKNAALNNLDVTGTKVVDYVTTPVSIENIPATDLVPVTDSKTSFRIALADLLDGTGNDVEGASYNLTVTGENASSVDVGLVQDISGNVGATNVTASFKRVADGTPASNTKATINTAVGANGIAVVDNNTLTVGFNQPVDGVTATNVANYVIDGAVVETAILNPAATDGTQTVTLKLASNSNLFTGARNVTISNVKAKNGLAMDVYRTTETLSENVSPTITSARLTTPTTAEVTFSEAVTNGTGTDFQLLVGGKAVTNTVATSTPTAATNTLTVTFGTAVTAADLAAGLSLSAVSTIDVQDAATNKVSASSVVTVTQ
ncbi:S-layer homology domain-containing protein [Planococcus sp. 107-1]|uniref:S-layer homology domain-containing protein n=1 Tax=Planococcus sp. 107-1 TaxID=2908840 RepID=UPI001F408860|nr:S-layer homology domain-containing protein [Planococcus sp. 107-1]UJF26211.1 S-layer homology domain-containing protein [Planococcus sp. 107-1]